MRRGSRLPVSVAAGSAPAADAGIAVLRGRGSAADAVIAMMLASCAAESVYTGLGGGGFATYYDAASDVTTCLDFFVAMPGLDGTPLAVPEQIAVDFGGQVVPYAVGPATVAVPGTPAGLAAIHERWGRKRWRDLVEPAVALTAAGVPCGAQQAGVLATVAVAMLRGEGSEAYAPGGEFLTPGGRLFHPGLSHSMAVLRDEGPAAFYTGRVGEAIVASVQEGGAVREADLAAYRPIERAPSEARLRDWTVQARGDDLDDLLGVLRRLRPVLSDDASEADVAVAMVDALRAPPRHSDTSNVVAVDADGNVCVMTTSLGLSSGVWVRGYGLHLNSMLGESELVRDALAPGARMGSMMSPLIARDDDGPVLAAGAAGGSRIRSALAQVLVRAARGRSVRDAIAAPRLNPVPGKVHAEPGFERSVLDALAAGDDVVVPWGHLDGYFGGVSGIDRDGPGADPRRDGDVRTA